MLKRTKFMWCKTSLSNTSTFIDLLHWTIRRSTRGSKRHQFLCDNFSKKWENARIAEPWTKIKQIQELLLLWWRYTADWEMLDWGCRNIRKRLHEAMEQYEKYTRMPEILYYLVDFAMSAAPESERKWRLTNSRMHSKIVTRIRNVANEKQQGVRILFRLERKTSATRSLVQKDSSHEWLGSG